MSGLRIFITLGILSLSLNLLAQKDSSTQTSVGQITFAYPLGIRGTESTKFSNKLSLNILYGNSSGKGLPVVEDVSKRVLRLPLFYQLTAEEIDMVCRLILRVLNSKK